MRNDMSWWNNEMKYSNVHQRHSLSTIPHKQSLVNKNTTWAWNEGKQLKVHLIDNQIIVTTQRNEKIIRKYIGHAPDIDIVKQTTNANTYCILGMEILLIFIDFMYILSM